MGVQYKRELGKKGVLLRSTNRELGLALCVDEKKQRDKHICVYTYVTLSMCAILIPLIHLVVN